MWAAAATQLPGIIQSLSGMFGKKSSSDSETEKLKHDQDIAGNSGPPTSAPSFAGGVKDMAGSLMDKGKEMLLGGDKGGAGLLSDAVSSLSGRAMDKLGSEMFDKSPEQKGQAQKAYADAAFPGTTPWEQLGGGGHGQGGGVAPKVAAQEGRITEREKIRKDERNMQKQLSTQETVADIQAKAHVDAAKIQAGHIRPEDPESEASYRRISQIFATRLKEMDWYLRSETIDQLLETTRMELTGRGIKSQHALQELYILGEKLKQAKSETEILRVTAKYIEYVELANIGEKGTRAIMNILAGGAAGRFMGKGIGFIPGKGPGGGPGGYFGQGKSFGNPGPGVGAYTRPPIGGGASPKPPKRGSGGRTSPKPRYLGNRNKKTRKWNTDKHRKQWQNN